MINEEIKNIYVYLSLSNKDHFVGTLGIINDAEDKQHSTFEYSDEWLNSDIAFPISVEMPLSKQVFTSKEQMFPIFYMQAFLYPVDFYFEYLLVYLKKHNLLSKAEEFDSQELYKWLQNADCYTSKFGQKNDYLKFLTTQNSMLYLNDFTRIGAFRFKSDKNGDFLQNMENKKLLTVDEIDKLFEIMQKINNNSETAEELELFHACSSSLKGRKPKANLLDKDENLCIAKISSLTDEDKNFLLTEIFALNVAKKFGINVQEYSVEKTKDGKEYLLLKRFDRQGKKRLHFANLDSVEGYIDYEDDKLIAKTITKFCKKNATKNLREFFRRKLFRSAITNTKAFLPNTGFLFDKETGWNLSPEYDTTVGFLHYDTFDYIKTHEKNEILLTATDYNQLMENAHHYRVSHKQAKKMVKELKKILVNYKEDALKIGFAEEDLCKIRIYLKAFDKIKYSYKK